MHSVHTTPCSVGFLVVFIGLLHCGRVHALMRRCIGSNGRHATGYCVDRGGGAGLRRGHACNARTQFCGWACMLRVGTGTHATMERALRRLGPCTAITLAVGFK